MKVLVTAFKPFNNQINNYSLEVLNYLVNVDKLLIDVVYDNCYKEIINNVNIDEYDLIVSLGEARSREELTLEVEAKNISSCSLKDNKGNLKKDELISPLASDSLRTKVDVNKVKDEVKLSFDAGKFVCNNLYFHLLENHPRKAIFIHVPNCHNDVKMYQKYAKKINLIIDKLLS
ncbi:MAG: hypothetical protein SOW55_00360 [Bacilli bacterium]|nr:hypothetical protein [Bacillales bacterium]MDY2574428.1 hypothetical protein [Bacilli bacterium]